MFLTFIKIVFISIIVPGLWTKQAPNIIIFYVDDLGWADVGYQSDHMLTPNIDTLAADGIVLNNYYTQPLCSPSRSALLTGVHPIHTGLQTSIIYSDQPTGLPLHFQLWPQYLKQKHNYSTHIVGKWHLGFARREYTPTYRGFDSHLGGWTKGIDYYHHIGCHSKTGICGLDFRLNMDLITNSSGINSTHYYTEHSLKLIDKHNVSQPLFLYIPYGTINPIGLRLLPEVSQHYDRMFAYIESDLRRSMVALAHTLDESVGRVVRALHSRHMLDNSIIIFASDNGGNPYTHSANGISNWPLRGNKGETFEGGIKVPAFIWSPLLNKSRYVSDTLVHVTDLLPTVLNAIDGTNINDQEHFYGISQWNTISNKGRPVRQEIIHGIDPINNITGLRWYNWKLVQSSFKYNNNLLYNSSQTIKTKQLLGITLTEYESLRSDYRHQSMVYNVLSQMGRKPDYDILRQTLVECGGDDQPFAEPYDRCYTELCLFNIDDDPCERYDLIQQTDPEFVHFLWNRLQDFNRTAVQPLALVAGDPKANPKLYNNSHVNWLDIVPGHNNNIAITYKIEL